MIVRQTYDEDGIMYNEVNYHELNNVLMRSDNIMFFLNLKAYCTYSKKSFLLLLDKLNDNVKSRIFYDTLNGIRIQENILEQIIIPTLVWCIQNNSTYLITPNFRLFGYGNSTMDSMLETIDQLVDDATDCILEELKMEYYEAAHVQPFVTYENATDIEAKLVQRTSDNLIKFTDNNMRLFLENPIGMDTFSIYKKSLVDQMNNKLLMGMYELGYEIAHNSYILPTLKQAIGL